MHSLQILTILLFFEDESDNRGEEEAEADGDME